MAKNETLKAVLYILAGVIIALLIFTFSGMGEKKSKDTENNATSTAKIATSTIWSDNAIVKIRQTIGKNFLEIRTEETGAFQVYKKADITKDGIDEALIDLGNGGAYTQYFALMQAIPNKQNGFDLKLARFKSREGKIGDVMFLEGASVSHGQSVELAPTKNAIYAESWSIDQINPDAIACEIEAYVWNKNNGIFEYNEALGKSATENYCSKIKVQGE